MNKDVERFIKTATEEELQELIIQLMEVNNPNLLALIERLLSLRQ